MSEQTRHKVLVVYSVKNGYGITYEELATVADLTPERLEIMKRYMGQAKNVEVGIHSIVMLP